MSSSHVLVVPIIACAIVGGIIIMIALAIGLKRWQFYRKAAFAESEPIRELRQYASRTDDAICTLISDLERIPATKSLLPDPTVEAIYEAHREYNRVNYLVQKELH